MGSSGDARNKRAFCFFLFPVERCSIDQKAPFERSSFVSFFVEALETIFFTPSSLRTSFHHPPLPHTHTHHHYPPPLFQTEFGEELKVVTAPSWDLPGIPMAWNDDHLWSAELPGTSPADGEGEGEEPPLEFKLVLTRPDGSVVWEEGPNKVIDGRAPAASALRVSWGFAEVEPVCEVVEEGAAAAAPGASSASPAPEPAAVVAPSSDAGEAVLNAMSQFAKSVSPPSSSSSAKESEEEDEEEKEVEAEAPVAAALAAIESETEPETAEAKTSSGSSSVQSAAAAAALGVGGALLATALAVDLTDAALLGAAAAAIAAATGSGSSPAAAAAGKAARAALEAPEKLLRSAGLKSFVEREAESKAAEEEAAAAGKEEEESEQ